MINVGFSLSLSGFEKEKLKNMNVLKEKLHDHGVELYIENYFFDKSISFSGYNESNTFDVALEQFSDFCREFLTDLKNNENDDLLEINPYFISSVIFWAEGGRRQRNIVEFKLSIQDTLSNNINGTRILELLYYHSIKKIKCATIEDFMEHAPNISDNVSEYKNLLEKLVSYGYIDYDTKNNYKINNLGIYILKWKEPYASILFNNDWPCDY